MLFLTKLCVSYSFASVCIYLVRPSPVNATHSTGHRIYIYIYIYMRILLCTWKGSRRGPWNSLFLYLGGTIGAQWAVDSAIGTGFYKPLSVFAKLYPPHMPQFYMPTIGNHRYNSKIAPISHYLIPTSTGKALALVASYAIFSAVNTRHRPISEVGKKHLPAWLVYAAATTCMSEMPGFYVSKVVFPINGTLN